MVEFNSTVSLLPGKEMLVCISQEASESVRTGLNVVSKKKPFTNRESNFGLVTAHASHCLPVLYVVILIKVAVGLFFDNVFRRSAVPCRPVHVHHSLWPDSVK